MIEKVTGQDCLDYIDRAIGFVQRPYQDYLISSYYIDGYLNIRMKGNTNHEVGLYPSHVITGSTGFIWSHNINKRKIGVVLNECDDNGLHVAILSNDTINYRSVRMFSFALQVLALMSYETDPILPTLYANVEEFVANQVNSIVMSDYVKYYAIGSADVSFDEMIDYSPYIMGLDNLESWQYNNMQQNGQSLVHPTDIDLTNNINTTLHFGIPIDTSSYEYAYCKGDFIDNPLYPSSGNLYSYAQSIYNDCGALCPREFEAGVDLYNYDVNVGEKVNTANGVAIPYNLILTKSVDKALNYLNNGILPSDAFLYPMDWDNFPSVNPDNPEDEPNDNTPDDDGRNITPNPPEEPTYTVNQLTNYNWYWLTVPEWQNFINWFWNDIGDYSDFDDIIAKVKGLYNDVASAVIMCRYYPVDISWIGGTGTQSNIKLGMIEKSGNVDTINQANPLRVRDLGHIHISNKYKSFLDLSPYSQLSLYLPYHGFIDLDINIFSGHDIYIKVLYDYLSGTIQYYVYYDNEMLVDTILCKMAMDIPITLQTKNDRDSAIFSNVSNTIGGLVGAGVGVASGNPIGMTLGVTQGVSAFNSANASAPMRLMGSVGESGAYIAPQNCYVILRRPTIQPSDSDKSLTTWKKNVGQLCGYGYKLSGLKGAGFTVCHSPRINFKNTAPMQTEVDEIYTYLEKGVIL